MKSNKNTLREQRKLEHLEWAIKLPEGPMSNGFDDIHFVHQALPELDYDEIDISCEWLGKFLHAPILINAITGGAEDTAEINGSLARVAKKFGLAMAVGSQSSALNNSNLSRTYHIARQENPKGLLLANVSAAVTWKEALQAVEMIEADGLQLHLNVLQELLMPEGDRKFKGILENISQIVKKCRVPVVVKEVGFGLSKESAAELFKVGVKHLDIGGGGGTNFAAIENSRKKLRGRDTFLNWGIPTISSLLEVKSLELPFQIVASGGIRTGVEIGKALCMGAQVVGIAGSFLKELLNQSEEALEKLIEMLMAEIKITLILTGSRNIEELREAPVVLTGNTLEWVYQRKLNIPDCYKTAK